MLEKLTLTFFLFISVGLTSNFGQGQDTKMTRSKEFYKRGKFEQSLAIIKSDHLLRIENPQAQLLMGLSYYHLNNLEESERILKTLLKDEKKSFKEALLYLGRIYHAKHEFETASKYYKSYLKSLDSNHEHRAMVRDAIRRCSNGLQIQFREPLAFVENMGEAVNTKYDEFGPNLSSNHSNKLYFSSARPGSMGGLRNNSNQPDDLFGNYNTDMYSVTRNGGQWQGLSPMHYFLNSTQNEVILGLSSSGKVLYYYQGNSLKEGQILVDTFQQGGSRRLTTNPFIGPIETTSAITAPHFVDSKILLFSSRQEGGYGGYDLYQSTYSNGQWSTPRNLGPDINTPYDEISPYLAADKKTLYFSTNNSNVSIGGFDIFKSVYNPQQNRWSKPYNLGLSINSAGDDSHFKLAKDGYTAYFCSNRKDSYGKRDLYTAYFYDFLNEVKAN